MDTSNFAFSKINYILLVIGLVIIILGLFLMSGSGTTEEAFNPEIFSATRIKVAPMISLFGFLFIIVAILWPSKKQVKE
ncbi:MAG: DUF3098 domain-containing protein [Bacteroidaceae bacterium]|nr:DUF3098 domain-containing protein [Bacteroidaceae bacterium]